MSNEIFDKKLLNLVQFELEKYCTFLRKNPSIHDERLFEDLRTIKAPLHRIIHWYLLDNKLIYQQNISNPYSLKGENINVWDIKEFDIESVGNMIYEKEHDSLCEFESDIEIICRKTPYIQFDLKKTLEEKGFKKQIDEKKKELEEKYEHDSELVNIELNKYLSITYFKSITA